MALTPTTEGLVMSVLLIGAALGSVFGGKFADYFGRRKYLLFLSFVFLSAPCFPPRLPISLPC